MANWRGKYAEFISQYPHKVGAEIGVLQGKLSTALLTGLPKLERLYCVDNWSWNHMENMMYYFKNMKPYRDRVKTLHMRSVEAHIFVEDESLDFLFIDANHRFESIVSEIVCWGPKVKKGGIVSGHDYIEYNKPNAYDVKGAVNKMYPKANIVGQIWWVIK